MSKEKLLKLLFNPFVIALPFALITILLNPITFKPRSLESVSFVPADKTGKNTMQYYHDLDQDGGDEIISIFTNDIGQCAIKIIQNQENNVGQWNFKGRLPEDTHEITYLDSNGDGILEVLTIYERNDSVFIGGVDMRNQSGKAINDFYIDRIHRVEDTLDYSVTMEQYDLNNDGLEEIVVRINAGYSELPRHIYAWDISANKLFKSPVAGFKNSLMIVEDIDDDGMVEVIPFTVSYENIEEGLGIPYNDYERWFVIYDNELNFKYGPISMGVGQGSVQTYISKNGTSSELLIVDVNNDIKNPYRYFKFNKATGKLDSAKPFYKPGEFSAFNYPGEKKDYVISYHSISGRLIVLDAGNNMEMIGDDMIMPNLAYQGMLKLPNYENPVLRFIESQREQNILHLIDIVSLESVITYNFRPDRDIRNIANYTSPDGEELIAIQIGDEKIDNLRFVSNPYYLLKLVLAYLGIYGFYVLLIWLILRLQDKILKKHYQREQMIAELKLKSIRNQLDPHFTFNAVNAIASAIFKEEKEKAYNYFSLFSRLLRATTLYSDRMTRMLKDEIEFAMQYLDIELFRYRDKFEYHIDVGDDVNVNQHVPRMIIQTFAESAVTNGLMHRKEGGKLNIKIRQTGHQLEMIFDDNGVGVFESKRLNKQKAFKSVKIFDEFIRIFNDLNHTRIKYELNDIGTEGKFPGTRAVVILPANYNYKGSMDA